MQPVSSRSTPRPARREPAGRKPGNPKVANPKAVKPKGVNTKGAERSAANRGAAKAAAGPTKTEGAVRAGNGRYHFNLARLRKVPAGTGYSSSHGGVV